MQEGLLEQRIVNLRAHLDSFDYRQPLGIESVPLVERLFSDVLKSNETVYKQSVTIEALTKDVNLYRHQAEPLQKENSNLVKENNALHAAILKDAEAVAARERSAQAAYRALADENKDLRFINSQANARHRQLEEALSRSREELSKLLSNAPVDIPEGGKVQLVGGRGSSLSFSQPAHVNALRARDPPGPPPHMVNLLSAAENHVSELHGRYDAALREMDALRGEAAALLEDVAARDQEITRLGVLVENGKDARVNELLHLNSAASAQIDSLSFQLDVLTKDLEAATADAAAKGRALDALARGGSLPSSSSASSPSASSTATATVATASPSLLKQLEALSRTAAALEERYLKRLAADTKVGGGRGSKKGGVHPKGATATAGVLKKSGPPSAALSEGQVLSQYMERLESWMSECERAQRECEDLRRLVDEFEERSDADARVLAELSSANASLKAELDRTSQQSKTYESLATAASVQKDREVGSLRSVEKTAAALQAALDEALSARDRAVQEAEVAQATNVTLTKEGAEMKVALATCNGRLSNMEADLRAVEDELGSALSDLRSRDEEIVRLRASARALALAQSSNSSAATHDNLASLSDTVANLREEAAAREREYNRLARELTGLKERLQLVEGDNRVLEDDLSVVREERDTLALLLQKTDTQNIDVQDTILSLSSERDTAIKLYDKVSKELGAKVAAEREASTEKANLRLSVALLTDERAALSRRLGDASSRADDLESALAAAQEDQLSLRSRLEEAVRSEEAAKVEARTSSAEREVLRGEVSALEAQVRRLSMAKDSVQNSAVVAAAASEEASARVAHLSALVASLESSRDSLASALAASHSDLAKLAADVAGAEDRAANEAAAVQEARAEVSRLAGALSALDAERDRLQVRVDTAEAAVVRATKEADEAKQRAADIEGQASQAAAAAGAAASDLNDRDSQVLGLARQLEAARAAVAQAEGYARESEGRVASLHRDLTSMVKENQGLNDRLDRASVERDRLARELAEAHSRLHYAEEAVRAKDRERADILDSYRAAADENSRLTIANGSLSTERNAFRSQAAAAEDMAARLRGALAAAEEDSRNFVTDLRAFERQAAELARIIDARDADVMALVAEREGLRRDVSSERELAAAAEAGRRSTVEELVTIQHRVSSLEAALEDARNDSAMKSARLTAELHKSAGLESLIAKERERALSSAHADRTSLTEIGVLKDQVRSLTLDRDSVARDLREAVDAKLSLTIENERLQRSLAAVDAHKAVAGNEAQDLRNRVLELESQVSSGQARVAVAVDEKERLKDYVVKYEAEMQKVEGRVRDLDRSLAAASGEVAFLRAELKRKTEGEAGLQRDLAAALTRARAAEADVSREGSAALSMNALVASSSERLAAVQRENAQLRGQVERLESDRARLEGLLGSVGDEWRSNNLQLQAHIKRQIDTSSHV